MDPIFIQTIKNTFGEDGEAWLSALPGLIAEASHRWGLTDIQPVPNLSYNFVSLALSGANESERSRSAHPSAIGFGKLTPPLRMEVILKLGVPNRELTGEIAALRFFNGRGACRLLDADAEKGLLLLERLQPGRMLSTIEDDEYAIRIAAEVMQPSLEICSRITRRISSNSKIGSRASNVCVNGMMAKQVRCPKNWSRLLSPYPTTYSLKTKMKRYCMATSIISTCSSPSAAGWPSTQRE